MNVGVATTEENPNNSWLSGRGGWASYMFGVFLLHCVVRCLPFVELSNTWTVTNVLHSVIMYIMFHMVKGSPWESTTDQGISRRYTHWEQIDSGVQFTKTKKFLTIFPICLFLLVSFNTKYDGTHFMINLAALLLVLLPKLPQLHKIRILDINKY